MLTLSILFNVLLLLLLLEAVRRGLNCRAWLRSTEGRFPSPIPVVHLDQFDSLFSRSEFGSTLQAEVTLLGGAAPGGTTDTEAWALATLAKLATCMFEFGTGSGKTAYIWARNSAAGARIVTLTLGLEHHSRYLAARRDSPGAMAEALNVSFSGRFVYTGTPVEHKICQLLGDSKEFDETPYLRQCDLIFIDGSHAYSYVKADTRKALRMLKPGGLILWHDYRYRNPTTAGVKEYLDELSQTLPLVRLHATNMVAYRDRGPALDSLGLTVDRGCGSRPQGVLE